MRDKQGGFNEGPLWRGAVSAALCFSRRYTASGEEGAYKVCVYVGNWYIINVPPLPLLCTPLSLLATFFVPPLPHCLWVC